MRLLFNAITLLLATTVLAAPIPSGSNDALADSASTNEHTLAHHHHVHHSKHAKHAAHYEESEVETRSLFNDELEERSFYDEAYTRLERRAPGGDKGKGKANPMSNAMNKLKLIVKPKAKSPPSPSSSSSGHSIDHSHHASSPVPAGHIAHQITPFHVGSSSHAGPSNHAVNTNKPLPALPHSPVRSNTAPSVGSSHGAPPPYSAHAGMHVVNPGSSHSGSVRQPQRSNTVGSSVSLAGTHGSTDRFSIDSAHSDSSVAGTSHHSHKRSIIAKSAN